MRSQWIKQIQKGPCVWPIKAFTYNLLEFVISKLDKHINGLESSELKLNRALRICCFSIVVVLSLDSELAINRKSTMCGPSAFVDNH